MREGREGLDALFEEAQRRWELPDVRRARRARADLDGWDVVCWLVPCEPESCLVLTDRLDIFGYVDGFEGSVISLQPGEAGVPVRVDPVDFSAQLLGSVRAVERSFGEDGRALVVSCPLDGEPVGLWEAFWTVHCAWQRGQLPPRLAEWFRANSLSPAPSVRWDWRRYFISGPRTASFIQEVGEELSSILYFNAVEKLQDTRWEELLPELDRIIRVLPRTRGAEEARLLKEGIESVIRDERALDLSKSMDQLSPEEARCFAAYTLREYADPLWFYGSAAWRMGSLETLAQREGRRSPLTEKMEAYRLPWRDLDAALPLLRAVRHDGRPTRSVGQWTAHWYRYYTVGEMAAGVARELAEQGGYPPDSDNDGLDDWAELLHIGTLDEDGSDDHDGDGLTNSEEKAYDTAPDLKDTDSDGYSDKEEIDASTDPLTPASRPGVVPRTERRFWVP